MSMLEQLPKVGDILPETIAVICAESHEQMVEGMLNDGIFTDLYYFCCRCKHARWGTSGIGGRHQGYALTPSVWLASQ